MINEVEELIQLAKDFNPRLAGNHRQQLKGKLENLVQAMEDDEICDTAEIAELKQCCEEIPDGQ